LKILPDGTVEGTPEELAQYQKALTVPVPMPFTTPVVVDPWLPNLVPYQKPQSSVCRSCQEKMDRGENTVCMCIFSGRGTTT